MGHLRVLIESETELKEHMSQLNVVHFWGGLLHQHPHLVKVHVQLGKNDTYGEKSLSVPQ